MILTISFFFFILFYESFAFMQAYSVEQKTMHGQGVFATHPIWNSKELRGIRIRKRHRDGMELGI